MLAEQSCIEHGLSSVELDEIVLKRIDKKWIPHERVLFSTKWFDYRFLHPAEATMLYMQEFGTAYRRFYAESVDSKVADLIRVPEQKDFLDLTYSKQINITGCWRGRQIADALGMPYSIYIGEAMKERLRFWQRTALPRPAQLYSLDIVEKMGDKWRQRQEGGLFYSNNSNYKNENYKGYKWQDDHHEWLFSQAEIRENKESLVSRFIRENLISQDKVRDRFGQESLEKSLSYL